MIQNSALSSTPDPSAGHGSVIHPDLQ